MIRDVNIGRKRGQPLTRDEYLSFEDRVAVKDPMDTNIVKKGEGSGLETWTEAGQVGISPLVLGERLRGQVSTF